MKEFGLEKLRIIDLVKQIHIGSIQLPQFQRDYKWKPTSVMKLLDSMSKLHPAGSLLFLEIDENSNSTKIAYEKVRTAPDFASTVKPKYLILDGQQRLTSCHSALMNLGTRTYYINLMKLWEKSVISLSMLDLIDDGIIIVKPHTNKPDDFLFTENLLPFYFLQSKEFYREHFPSYKDTIRRNNSDEQFVKFLDSQLENFLDAFFDYQYPTIILPKNLEIDAICKVFQTINTTGLKLSAFDICVATFMPDGIKLKEELEEAKNDYPELSQILNDDETVILQTIALLSNVSAKKNNLPKNLKAIHIKSEWEKAIFSMKNCVDILDDIGVQISNGLELLPYQPIFPVISAVLAKTNYEYEKDQTKKGSIKEKIKKWFFTVCLKLRYTEGTDNKMKEDYEALLEWITLDKQPLYIEQPMFWNIEEIALANKNGAFGKAILVALNSNSPKDFYTTTDVGFKRSIKESCDLHHIFPIASYKENPLINSVFNFTYLTSRSNQYIKAKRTDEYIKKICNDISINETQLKERMRKHFIDEDCYMDLLQEDLTSFISHRILNYKKYLTDNLGLSIIISEEKNDENIVDIEDNFSQS